MNSSIQRMPLVRVGILLILSVIALGGCSQGSNGGALPAAALAVVVNGGGSNPQNVINSATAPIVDVEVTLPSDSKDTDVVTVVLSDPAATEAAAQGQGNGVTGGGTVHVQVDASGLADGPIDVLVQTQDGAESRFTSAFTKDTVAPALPTTLAPLDAQGAPSLWVNLRTVRHATVGAGFQAAGDGSDSAQLYVRDGTKEISTPPQTYAATLLSFQDLDLTVFPDDVLDFELVLTDANMNSASMIIQATKDTVAPAGALAAQLPGGASNPTDTINLTTAPAVTALMAIAADVEVRTVVVSLADSQTTLVSQPASVPLSGGVLFVSGVDASSLSDGPVTVIAIVSDAAGNQTPFTGVAATKDTVPPAAPSTAAVTVGSSNPPSVINLASAFAVGVTLAWPATSSATDTATVQLTNGVTSTISPTLSAPGGSGSSNVTGLNCSGITDGAVALAVIVTDPAGNTTSFTGTPATKDTVPPVAPVNARVAAGVQNASDIVNIATVNGAFGATLFPASAQGNEAFVMSFSDGTTTVTSASAGVPAGGGSVPMGPVNLSALTDGPVTVMVTVSDPAQNTTSLNGSSALKDTVAPTGATAASVSSGSGNGANVINLSNAGTVAVAVTWPAGAPGTETAQITVSHGASVSAPVMQTTGSGVVTVPALNASALTDGSVAVTVVTTDPAGNSVSFNGTAATKDTVAPGGATNVTIPGGGSNPPNWVNAATASAASVSVTFPASASGSDTVYLSCSDGSTTAITATQPVPGGGGVVSFSSINMGALSDGSLTLAATVSDTAGNTTVTNGTGAAKDTVAPANPSAAQVPAGASNPADMINTVTVLASSVNVSWPGDAGNESMWVVLSDGVSAQASTSQTLPSGAGLIGFGGLDCSPLSDGPITIMVQVTDAAGNQTTYTGTAATKDTVPPAAPTSAHVALTASNAVDTINIASAGAVTCSVVFSPSGNPQDVATLTLSGGATGVSTPAMSVVPGGTVTYPGISAVSLSDGAISLSVNLVDPAGNVTTFAGTAATKDTVAPSAPASASIPASASNPFDTINLATQNSVSVNASVPSQGSGLMVSCDLTDGLTVLSFTSVPAPSGGGLISFTGLDASPLSDLPITITVRVSDGAGNAGTFVATASKDIVPPMTPLVDPTTTPTSATQQTITGETDASTTVSVVGGASPATGTSSGTGRFAIPVLLAAGGPNTLVVTATDAAGNPSSSTVDFTASPLTIVQNASTAPVVFTDISVASGLNNVGSVGGGSFQDIDNDGNLDLFVGGTNKLWRNNGSGVFTDITATSGVAGGGTSAQFADFDNDGDLDLVVVNGSNVTLFRNEWVPLGVRVFTDVTATSGAGATGTLAMGLWLDLNNDGWSDFVVTGDGHGPQVRLNQGNGTFVAQSLFGPLVSKSPFGLVADIIADNRTDLIFADATPSFFYRNDGLLTFTDVAGATSNVSITGGNLAGGMIAVDYDNDGDLDIIVAGGGALGNNQLFVNNGTSSFTDQVAGQTAGLLAGIEASDGWIDVCAGDVNNDGLVDLYVGRNGANRLFLNVGDTGHDGIFEYVDVAGPCGVGGSGQTNLVQMADLDGDGDLDLFAGNDQAANEVHRNDVNNHRNLTVLVHGLGTGAGTSSRDAIGAHVELRDAAGTAILASREMSGGRGHGSQDALRAHFGVTPSEIYTVRVTFPSGAVRIATNVVPRDAANQTITINE